VTSCLRLSRSFARASSLELVSGGGEGEGVKPPCDLDLASPRATAEDIECKFVPFACREGDNGLSSSSTSSGSSAGGGSISAGFCWGNC
jgi:hypothetical protein